MRILVTGGAGFIGSHTVAHLMEAGDEVLVVDNLSSGYIIPPKPGLFSQTDIFSDSLATVWKEFSPEVVIHLAAQVDVDHSWEFPSEDLKTNVEGTLRILELCKVNRNVKLILASSAAVYGASSGKMTETSTTIPCSPYGLGKLTAEKYLEIWAQRWDIPWIVLRYANVYGPYAGDKHLRGVCSIFAYNLMEGYPIIINGTGNQMRDFVSVYDVARANYLAAHSDLSQVVMNVSSGEGHSILEVLNIMLEASSIKPEVLFLEEKNCGVEKNILSSALAKNLLNWEPKWKLRDGLKDLWYKANFAVKD